MKYFEQPDPDLRPKYEPPEDKLNMWYEANTHLVVDKKGMVKYHFDVRMPIWRIKWILFKDWVKIKYRIIKEYWN